MRLLANVTVPKEVGDPKSNEDYPAWRFAKRTWALSDGASESFAAKKWARILALSFVDHPYIDENWFVDVGLRYERKFERTDMTWSRAAAFERGSFATLLGVIWYPEIKTLDVVAFGDSIAVLFDNFEPKVSFPYSAPEQFYQRPLLISSRQELNHGLMGTQYRLMLPIGRLKKPRLLLVTDALGCWILGDLETRSAELFQATDAAAFSRLVVRERSAKRMRVDDTTMLVLG